MISTETPATSAWVRTGAGPSSSQTATVKSAIAITTGTKIRTTRSASACTGSLAPCAVSTIATMRASTVSCPTAVARKLSAPAPLTVPPTILSPGPLATGSASPVIMDSSM